MSRSKKSRKPGRIKPSSAPKNIAIEDKEPRARKKSGNKAGTRQEVAKQVKKTANTEHAKDPRIGSKKPIDLGVKTKATNKPVVKKAPIAKVAAVRVVESAEIDREALLQELFEIEHNEELQDLAIKADMDETLTAEESDRLEQSFTRYTELMDILGIEESDEESDEDLEDDIDDEEALWDKFDDGDLSEFKE